MLYYLLVYSRVIQIYIYIYIFRFFPTMAYYKILNTVPCVVQ